MCTVERVNLVMVSVYGGTIDCKIYGQSVCDVTRRFLKNANEAVYGGSGLRHLGKSWEIHQDQDHDHDHDHDHDQDHGQDVKCLEDSTRLATSTSTLVS